MNQGDKNIDYALIETLRVHPDYSRLLVSILFDSSTNKVNPARFTRSNNARSFISNLGTEDFIRYILKKSVILFQYISKLKNNSSFLMENGVNNNDIFPNFSYIQEKIKVLLNPKVNSIAYFKSSPYELLPFVQFVVSGYFGIENFFDRDSESYTAENIESLIATSKFYEDTFFKNKDSIQLCNKIENDYQKLNNVFDLEFNLVTVNRCLEEVLSGKQIKNKHSEYQLGDTLYATQDIGNKRTNQEDSVLIMSHPENEDFKILVVSDGMGGTARGEIASQIVVQEMSKWFRCIPKELYFDSKKMQELFNREIVKINDKVYQKLSGSGGATFVGAVVTKNQTIISNVGDSRAMLLKWNKLKLITEDDSIVFRSIMAQKGRKLSKEEIDQMRFNHYSNRILRYMGVEELSDVQSYLIHNFSYDKLLLFSDGITDLLSFDQIKIISRMTSPELITNTLVKEALSRNVYNSNGRSEQERGYISAGKDNATAAMYVRR